MPGAQKLGESWPSHELEKNTINTLALERQLNDSD